jgi:type II secretory pathway component PulF
MALYFYQAYAKDGKKITGHIDAPSLQSVKEQLGKQGLFPVSIELGSAESKQPWYKRIFASSISTKEKILFTRQLVILLRSGIPLLQALELLVDQLEGPLRSTLVTIKDEIREGSSFADALKKYPRIFDSIYVQLVRAGEASGNLEKILERLATYLERRAEIAKRVKSALQYPLMQLGVSVIAIVIMLTKIVPGIAENFTKFGKELPLPTEILLAVSDFVSTWYLVVLILIILGVVGLKYWAKTPSGARTIDKIKLRIPIVRYFTRMNAIVQFSYTLGMLLEGGVNLAESLDIVCNIIDNRILADALREARDKIIKQGKITQYLKQTNIFPAIAIYLIKTGEESGKLDEMLLTVARNYEEDLGDYADSLTAKIGPLLLIFMTVVVGFIVISIAMPMAEMGELAGEF